jgi:hypothetical protein
MGAGERLRRRPPAESAVRKGLTYDQGAQLPDEHTAWAHHTAAT